MLSEGFRLIEEREAQRRSLRETIQASLKRGGQVTGEELEVSVNEAEDELAKAGY